MTQPTIIEESFEDPEPDFAIPKSKLMSPKSRTTAFILSFFLGGFGAHRFYVGKPATGVLMLLTLGGLGFWALIDCIRIAAGSFKDGNGRRIKYWDPDDYVVSR